MASVTLSAGWVATVADFNCQTVIAAFLPSYPGSTNGDCNHQTVGVGTSLVIRNSSGGSVGQPTVSAVSGWTMPSSSGQVNYQPQIDAHTTRITSLESRATSLEAADVQTAQQIATNTTAVGNVNSILNTPFDLGTALAGTAFFFSTTLFFYGISRAAGAILEKIRRPLGRG